MKKRIISLLCAFLVMMILFTILSRAANSVTVPKVTAKSPEQKKITHQVTGSGKIEAIREQAVSILENQIVKAIYTEEGAQVTAGDVLFEVDLQELEEQILLARQEIEKLKLQQQDTISGEEVTEQQQETAKNRAAQDYQDAVGKGDAAVAAAAAALQDASNQLAAAMNGDTIQDSDGTVEQSLQEAITTADDTYENAKAELKKLQDSIAEEITASVKEAGKEASLSDAEKKAIEAKVNKKYKTALKDAEKRVTAAQAAQTEAAAALTAYQQEKQAAQEAASAASVEELKALVQEKQEAYNTAVSERDANVKSAARSVEDAAAPSASNSTSKTNEIDIEQKELALDKLEALKKANGQVLSPITGVLLTNNLTIGERTTSSPAMKLAVTDAGVKLKAQVSADLEKYIAAGDSAVVTPSSSKEAISGLTVDAVSVNEEDNSLLDVTIKLTDSSLGIGTAADMKVERDSQAYSVCVPVQALYQDNNQYYVLVTTEVETVLGTELKAQRMDVTVVDKNESYAAISEESLKDQKVIVSSDKDLEDGNKVRLEET